MADTNVSSIDLALAQNRTKTPATARAAVLEKLRRLLPGMDDIHNTFPFGLPALDAHLPQGGLARGALHEVVPKTENVLSAAFGFVVAVLARLSSPCGEGLRVGVGVGVGVGRGCTSIDVRASPPAPPPHPPPQSLHSGAHKRGPGGRREKIFLVLPAYGQREHGRLCGHGLNSLGLDPAHITLVETAHRKETLWAVAEALHSGAPLAVAAMIDRLDLKTSQKLHLAASDTGLPLLLIRPAQTLEASAAATRWRVGTAEAARDRFGLLARPRWHLQLERCRNGRPGEWNVEYDHVTHRFSLASALADHALSRGAGDRSLKYAPVSGRS